jgi:hypothetical protein
MLDGRSHEEAVIRAFILRTKRERFIEFLATARNRKKFTGSLPHFRWFDPRFTTPIPWKPNPDGNLPARYGQGIENIKRLLQSKGAGPTCWVISDDSEIDGQELDLGAALEHVTGMGIGTILSCVPGKLAYFEGEDETLLLAR